MNDYIAKLNPKTGDLIKYFEEFYIYLGNCSVRSMRGHALLRVIDMTIHNYFGSELDARMICRIG